MTCSYNTYYIIFGEETTMILVTTYRIGYQHQLHHNCIGKTQLFAASALSV